MHNNTLANLKLFSYWRSSCSWRVRLALNLKALKYETIPINLLKGEHKEENYKKLNPSQKVPCLQFDKDGKTFYLSESLAICEFLEEALPDTRRILPENPLDRATVRKICNQIASGIQPLQNLSVIYKVGDIGGDKQAWSNEWITKGLDALESQIKETRGKYCFGDQVTMADVCLVPQLYNARRFNCDLSRWPNLLEIETNLKTLEEFQKAAPENQPDATQS